MATGGLAVIRDNLFYIGGAKESVWGTPVAPTWFHRWLDSTDADGAIQYGQEREGDTSPYLSLIYKSGQYWAFKIVEYVRPQIAGYALQALLGTGSDTYVAPTKTSTVGAAGILAGATTFPSVVDLGNTGTGALNFDPGYANPLYEVQTVDFTTRTGAGTPWTYTLAGGAKFTNAHAAAAVINSASSHTFACQPYGFDPYSYEFGWGAAGAAISGAFRMVDAVCTGLTISGQRGQPIRFESDWLAASAKELTALQTPSYEGTNVVGAAGGPLVWHQGNTWNINGATTGNAATIQQFALQLRRSTTWDDLQTELVTPSGFLPGNIDISGQFSVAFVSWAQYSDMYFANTTFTNNAVDSYLVGYESLLLQWASDAVNTFKINLPRINYTAGKLSPKLDGKALKQPISFTASKPQPGASFSDAAIFTLTNSNNAQY